MEQKPVTYPDVITIAGNEISFWKPQETTISIDDLRTHTMNICRYNGAVNWRLVQHLALCGKWVSANNIPNLNKAQLIIQTGYAVLHDMHEVYLGDVVTGLKKYLNSYQDLETLWEIYVHDQLELPIEYRKHEFIRYADKRALIIESCMLNHPLYDLLKRQDINNTMLTAESELWSEINELTLEECWDYCYETLTLATSQYNKLMIEILSGKNLN